MRKVDLTGIRFDMLVAIEQAPNKGMRVAWRCICDCGKETTATSLNLRSGNTGSCGCRANLGVKPQYNRFEEKDDYMIGYTLNGMSFIFDKEDYDKVKVHCWGSNQSYLETKVKGTQKPLRLHRLVMGINNNDKRIVDHINHDPRDNRKCNLRLASRGQNNMNITLQKNSTTKVTGVVYDKERHKWKAQIGVNYKNIILGRFETFEEAVQARKDAEQKYFGEFAYSEEVNRVEY